MDIIHQTFSEHVVIRRVSPACIMRWLRLAARDFRRVPADALFYGAAFVLMGYLLCMYVSSAPQFVLTMSTLFLLAGPFLAIGIYDLARQMEGQQGRRVHVLMRQSLFAWHENLQAFTLYAVLMAILAFSWFRVSMLMFALFYDYSTLPALNDLLVDAFLPQNITFLLVYFATGFLFAVLAFALSVVSVPMMLDKEVDTVTAMVSSMQAVRKNLLTMTLWAAMIVLLTAVGLATYFIGLIITMPLIGLASWHAYRDLITYEH